ncbi:hypothetical protein ERO13_A10G140250v2 [Gossypium hirsutum]|uniref:Uncharacterized protein n=1 Tax=Gossypium mustelinum TaxID=34275 RepID=A0A5D2XM42_GOSMU|nr:hypothetical protein ERO13_A10G140250v2 [Gossypium hirsutum]TYJ15014.1 hypothetical protein E1A91_A10G155900v1 [Gossypium mustelinum]
MTTLPPSLMLVKNLVTHKILLRGLEVNGVYRLLRSTPDNIAFVCKLEHQLQMMILQIL